MLPLSDGLLARRFPRYLGFYVAGGFAATVLQTAMTLGFSPDADARIPMLGASGAISAVLGAFLALYPHARIKTLVLVFVVQIPAWVRRIRPQYTAPRSEFVPR